MSEDFTIRHCRKIEFTPSWSIPEDERRKSDSLLPSPPSARKTTKTLEQIEFSTDNQKFVFPDFNNIFSRSELVKSWWFLPPEVKGKAIYQSQKEIDTWMENLQDIYSSTILSKIPPVSSILPDYIVKFPSNYLVDSLYSRLAVGVRMSDTDSKDSVFSICYYHRFFKSFDIEQYRKYWMFQRAVLNYYHTIFAPALKDKEDNRKMLRLSNRFPEYARAVDWLNQFREFLYSEANENKGDIDRFFKRQSLDRKNEAKQEKDNLLVTEHCQCRICGLVFLSFFTFTEFGGGQGKDTTICSSPACEGVWESFRKSLPPNPHDYKGGNIQITHL